MLIVTGRIKFKDILNYLDVLDIPGCDDAPDDWIDFLDCVDITESDIPAEWCDICGGVEPGDVVEAAVNPWLIKDFVAAIRRGDLHTAQQLVGRVFDLEEDSALVDRALCRCAA